MLAYVRLCCKNVNRTIHLIAIARAQSEIRDRLKVVPKIYIAKPTKGFFGGLNAPF
jgi:hypothetical protein